MSSPDPSLESALAASYRLDRELGRGGMAVVYLAHDKKHDRSVALKIIRPDADLAGAAERFTREIRLAARLQHPHILPVFDSGEAAGQLWYTMPFVEGESLRDQLEREHRLPVAEAVRIAREAAQGLAHAHEHSVIHRDIKPENLLLTKDDSVLVADFGIARAIAPGTTTSGTGTTQLTETGIAIGTPAYMAPETRLGAPADVRSDIYSLAAVLYEMLTGKMLSPGGGFSVDLLMNQTAPLVRASRSEVPPGVDVVIRRALHPDPAQRFESMREFGAALGRGTDASRVKGGPFRIGRYWLIAVSLILVVSLSLFFRHKGSPAPTATRGVVSIAVLPFQNIGGDTTEVYLAQGMADEVTTSLVQHSDIQVASQNGLARIHPEMMTASEVGRVLRVNAVLNGTVRRLGNRLRITTELTSTSDGVVLWADHYDRELQDVFQVQDDITQSIVTSLTGALAARGQSHTRGTGNLDAYDLYLRGRYFWSRRGREGITKALDYLTRATLADSTFAKAYGSLAMAYVVLPVFSKADPDSAMQLAEKNASRALALDSSLADAHLALAYLLKNRWRFAESEREFRSAIQLAPNDPVVHHWYGVFLYAIGRVNESVEQMSLARQLDPFGATIGTDGAVALYADRRYVDAREEAARSLALDSAKSDTWLTTGWIMLAQGKGDSAIMALNKAKQYGTGFDTRPFYSVGYRLMGRAAEADRLYHEVRENYLHGQGDAYSFAIAATAAGDKAQALGAVAHVVSQRSFFVTELSLPCDPLLDALESDPYFTRTLQSAGMSPCQKH
jgi:eukaryotic-like serine/threonine-protein kinase